MLKRRKKTKTEILSKMQKFVPEPKVVIKTDTFQVDGGWTEDEKEEKMTQSTNEPIGKMYGLTTAQARSSKFKLQIK